MAHYFAREKRGAAVFVAVGTAALAAATLVWGTGTPHRGMAVPLGVIGLLQLVVGASVFLRTDGRVVALRGRLAADAPAGRGAERDRMRRVVASFRVYRAIEIAMLTAGLTLLFLFPRRHPLWAAGLGCLLQGSVTLVLDRLAERRAEAYLEALDGAGARPSPPAPS